MLTELASALYMCVCMCVHMCLSTHVVFCRCVLYSFLCMSPLTPSASMFTLLTHSSHTATAAATVSIVAEEDIKMY